MTGQTATALAAYLATTLALLAALRAHLTRRRMMAMTSRLHHAMADMEKHRAFVYWGQWTMLSVTTRDGDIEARTLRQFYDQATPDRVWDTPIAVSLWTATPEVLDSFRTELEAERRSRRA